MSEQRTERMLVVARAADGFLMSWNFWKWFDLADICEWLGDEYPNEKWHDIQLKNVAE